MRVTLSALLAFAFVAALAIPANATSYQLHVLNSPAALFRYSAASDINSSNTVVGSSSTSRTSNGSACSWSGSNPTNLGQTCPGSIAINNQGTIVCGKYMWQYGLKSALTPLEPSTSCVLTDINNQGVVVGRSQVGGANGNDHACVWTNSAPVDLVTCSGGSLTPDEFSTALSINDNGDILIGSGITEVDRGFVWQKGNMTLLTTPDGYQWFEPCEMNNATQVVGQAGYVFSVYGNNGSYIGQDWHSDALVWQNGIYQNIGVSGLNTVALGVNNRGQVVGYSRTTDFYDPVNSAVVWDNGVMSTLPSLGASATAVAINDNGWIVGSAYDTDGYRYAVVWQPVPEPSSVVGLAGSLVAFIPLTLRRRPRR